LLGEFVAREGAARALADELEKKGVDAPRALFLYEQWIASGLFDVELSGVISQLAGVEIGGYEFSESLAKELARLAKEKGDRVKGEALFHSQKLGCAACHQLGEVGGTLGPDLSAVGSGVPPERIVTEVLWPDRQVKAGFVLNSITLNDNRVFHGYVKQSRDENQILLFDFVTRQTRDLSKNEIKSRDSVGSLMPETAQSLTREQVADLVAYLIGLRR
jgi:putative heme-binding domain-containing protein